LLIKLKGFLFVRTKIYGKTEDKLTSMSVKNNLTQDPLSKLLLANDKLPKYMYLKKLLQ